MRRPPPDPSRVHSVTLAIWLTGVFSLALIWAFPRFFGAIALMLLGIAAYAALYAWIEARMAAGDLASSLDEEDMEEVTPVPARPRRPRRRKTATPAEVVVEPVAPAPAPAPVAAPQGAPIGTRSSQLVAPPETPAVPVKPA